jgi:hypothetical protein
LWFHLKNFFLKYFALNELSHTKQLADKKNFEFEESFDKLAQGVTTRLQCTLDQG